MSLEPAFKGTYGEVFLTFSGKNVKKYVGKYDIKTDENGREEHFFESTSIKEMVSLSSLPYMQYITNSPTIVNHSDVFSIKMPYRGITLTEWCARTELNIRIKKLPSIVFQILEVLKVLEDRELIHGDIKPDNILIDGYDRITVIDFGGCVLDTTIVKYCKEAFNMCTYWFSSPEMLSLNYKDNTISHKHDIFSLGLVIKFILIGGYTKDDDKVIEFCEKSKDIETYPKDAFTKILKDEVNNNKFLNELIDLSLRLLTIDQSKRPSAMEILNNSFFGVTNNGLTLMGDVIYSTSVENVVDTKIRRELVRWIFYFCKDFNFLHLAVLAVWIFDKSIQRLLVGEREQDDVAGAALLISDSLLQHSKVSIQYMATCISSIKKLHKMVCSIMAKLKYRVYVRTFDYYLRRNKNEVDYDVVRDICLIGGNMKLGVWELIEMYKRMCEEKRGKKEEMIVE